MIDRRKSNRVQVTSYLRINYNDNHSELGRVVDISIEGMKLCGAEPIQTDRTLTLWMDLPLAANGKSEIDFYADIIWCRRSKLPMLYDTGIRLKGMTPERIELIEKFLENLSREERWLSIIKNIKEDD